MAYNKDLDVTLKELEPIKVPVLQFEYHFRIKRYGKTAPKLEVTKTFERDDGSSGETQRLGRVDLMYLRDFAQRFEEAARRIEDKDYE